MEIKHFFEGYPNLSKTSIQIFDDSEDKSNGLHAKILTWNSVERLRGYNEQGYGIFFSVNSMAKGTRSKATCTGINAWICEMDNCSKSEQILKLSGCPLLPSMIIESKKSYHCYRFSEDGTIENRHIIGQGLRDYFDGDPAVAKDYARVLRIPGFNHLKDKENPHKVSLEYFMDVKYTEKDMMEAFPFVEKIKPKNNIIKKIDSDDFWEVVNSRNATNLLQRVSGTHLVNGDVIEFKQNSNGTMQIFCNDKSTSSWVDTSGLIGSHDGGGPSRVNWVLRYCSVDTKTLAEWIKSNCLDILPDNLKETKREISIVADSDELFSSGECFSRGVPALDRLFGMPDENDLVLFAGFAHSGKTQFTFFMAEHNARAGTKTCYYTLEITAHTLKKRTAREAVGLTKYDLQTKRYSDYHVRKMKEVYSSFDNIPNFVLAGYDGLPTIEDLLEDMEHKVKEGYKMFFIDNLGKIAGDSNENSRFDKITSLLQTFKNNHHVCIVLIHHLNKPGKGELDAPGGIRKVRGSQKVVDNATIVVEIRRDQDPSIGNIERKYVTITQEKDTQGGVIAEKEIIYDAGRYKDSVRNKDDVF